MVTGPEGPVGTSAHGAGGALRELEPAGRGDSGPHVVRARNRGLARGALLQLRGPRQVIDAVGPPSSDIPWDADDFEFFHRARPGRRLPDRPGAPGAPRSLPRFGRRVPRSQVATSRPVGEKLVSHPGLYFAVPATVLAGIAPPLGLLGLLLAGRHPQASWSDQPSRRTPWHWPPPFPARCVAPGRGRCPAPDRPDRSARRVRSGRPSGSGPWPLGRPGGPPIAVRPVPPRR